MRKSFSFLLHVFVDWMLNYKQNFLVKRASVRHDKMNLQCVGNIITMISDFGNFPFTYIRWEEVSYCRSTIEDFQLF